MIRLPVVLGVARAEARSLRRLVRFWMFAGLAGVVTLFLTVYYNILHGLLSHFSGSIGITNPRFLLASASVMPLALFLVGFVFMAFDVRARDQREHMAEVLDTRPMSNLELLAGRFLGTLLTGWLLLAFGLALLQLLAWTLHALGSPVGEPMQLVSTVSFLVFTAIPGFAFTLAFIYLLSVLLKNRFLTAVVALTCVGLTVWRFFRVTIYATQHLTPGFEGSDLVPYLIDPTSLLARAAMLAIAVGMLVAAAALYPRLDDGSKPTRLALGGAVALLGVAVMGGIYWSNLRSFQKLEGWKEAHRARQDERTATIGDLRGRVSVRPGKSLEAELELELVAPENQTLNSVLLSLNPGLELTRVADAQDRELEHTFAQGLLDIQLAEPLAPAATTKLRLAYRGRPAVDFGYLDSAIEPLALHGTSGQLVILGLRDGIFDRRYVALMPALRWLPASGADYNRDARGPELFKVDLTVDVPDGWLAAGPGRRQAAEGAAAGRRQFRFAPDAVVPEVALIASRFESRSTEVDGVELEVLLHPRHAKILDLFTEAAPAIEQWVGERLSEASSIGLDYPYGALTMVEVPQTLRSYGGGWRMDTVQAPPAMLLLRENSLPTSRFAFFLRNREALAEREGGVAGAERQMLERFFENDFSGGNIFIGAARNFLLDQTQAVGPGAVALDYVVDDLTTRLLTDKQSFFSAFLFDQSMGTTIQGMMQRVAAQRGQISAADALVGAVANQSEIWEHATTESLAGLDPSEDPHVTIGLLALKGKALSRSLLDELGREKTGQLLATLRAEHTGGSFDSEDFLAAGERIGVDLHQLLGDWLHETDIPGFVYSPPKVARLTDDANGSPRYQLTFNLRNDQPAPGLVRVRYALDGDQRNDRLHETEAIRVGGNQAVEVGVVTAKPVERIVIAPYISLNRDAIQVPVPKVAEDQLVDAEPFDGSRPSDWRLEREDWIVVDDLDPGFSVVDPKGPSGLRLGAFAFGNIKDNGLPVLRSTNRPPAVWSRLSAPRYWGRYRHTVAVVRAGDGAAKARFAADLPAAGRWRLSIHLPGEVDNTPAGWRRGDYHLAVVSTDGDRTPLTFDAQGAQPGWNDVGEVELSSGSLTVELSNQTDGGAVIADAIRWQPVAADRLTESLGP